MALFRKPKPRNVRLHHKTDEKSFDGVLTHIMKLDGVNHYVLEAPVMYVPVIVDGKSEIQRHTLQSTAWFQCSDVLLLEVYP